jgi:hypothetical protein
VLRIRPRTIGTAQRQTLVPANATFNDKQQKAAAKQRPRRRTLQQQQQQQQQQRSIGTWHIIPLYFRICMLLLIESETRNQSKVGFSIVITIQTTILKKKKKLPEIELLLRSRRAKERVAFFRFRRNVPARSLQD